MSKYTVNFDLTSVELLPPSKRETESGNDDIENLLFSFAAPLNQLETIFTYQREGTGANDYDALAVYVLGDLVNYQSRVYYKNEITEDYIAGILPTNTDYFVKVLDYIIGLNDRIRFSPNKLILEYALNAIFNTTFNQPPTLSDIYITRLFNDSDCFQAGETEAESSTVAEQDVDSEWSIPETEPSGAIQYDYVVNVPVAVWTALSSSAPQRDAIILSVLNKFKLFGFIAEVQTY